MYVVTKILWQYFLNDTTVNCPSRGVLRAFTLAKTFSHGLAPFPVERQRLYSPGSL